MTDWRGNLDDDCWLERYGMIAHVEQMDRTTWWFAISRSPWPGPELYNSANMTTAIRLRNGGQARAAAEHCLELLNQAGQPHPSGGTT